MSSHCGRYPNCGCGPDIGSKCGLPSDDPRLLEPFDKEKYKREQAEQFQKHYPHEHNRAQRRANQAAKKKRDREDSDRKALSGIPFKWKKDRMKVQKRKGGAKRRKK